jgi:hypothetical protein
MKTNKEEQPTAILHGECIVFQTKIPNDVVEEHHSGSEVRIADSETTGNHHVIVNKPGIKFYHNSKNQRFMRSDVETEVRCVMQERHDTITLPPGEYGIDLQQEFDYFTLSKQNVRD